MNTLATKKISLEHALTIEVKIGMPRTLGLTGKGVRTINPIDGGKFYGSGISGQVLPGGADFFLERTDKIGEMEVVYTLETDDGQLINIRNTGYFSVTDAGRTLDAKGVWPLPEDGYRCRCSPVFQTAEGKYDWLSRAVFYGVVSYPSALTVVIELYSDH
jgi:hypothetical protein